MRRASLARGVASRLCAERPATARCSGKLLDCAAKNVEVLRTEFAFVGERNSDYGSHGADGIMNGQGNGGGGIDCFRSRTHIPGLIFFEIAGRNGSVS